MADLAIVLLNRDAQGDVVYWAGWTRGHDGQGWTADRGEALTFTWFAAANLERKVARRYHPTWIIESEAQDVVSDDDAPGSRPPSLDVVDLRGDTCPRCHLHFRADHLCAADHETHCAIRTTRDGWDAKCSCKRDQP